MFVLKFNLLYTESYYKYVNFHGGSKPPPYAVELNFRIYTRLLSNLKNLCDRRDRACPCPQKNYILNQFHGQPQGLSLRFNISF